MRAIARRLLKAQGNYAVQCRVWLEQTTSWAKRLQQSMNWLADRLVYRVLNRTSTDSGPTVETFEALASS